MTVLREEPVNYSGEKCEGEKIHYDVAVSFFYSVISPNEMMDTPKFTVQIEQHIFSYCDEYFNVERRKSKCLQMM